MTKQKILNLDNPKDFKIWMEAKEKWLNDEWKKAAADPRFQPL